MLEPDVEERLSLFFRIVKGWLLGSRLTGKGVTVHVEGTSSEAAQPRSDASVL